MASPWTMLLVGLLTGGATLLGGGLVFRFKRGLDFLLGFSSGAVIGVALFDLLPEGLDLAGDHHTHLSITSAAAAGFLFYLAADRASALLAGDGGRLRHFAPASLTMHSLLDGLGIGLAFHVSAPAGIVVAAAVLAHDFVDGANTVVLSLAGGSGTPAARAWLAADAIAPLVGMGLAAVVTIPTYTLAVLLGVFAGFFLYIGTGDLIPLSQAGNRPVPTILSTGAGMAFIYAVISLVNA